MFSTPWYFFARSMSSAVEHRTLDTPGAPIGAVADIETQGSGPNSEEAQFKELGLKRFSNGTIYGPFGTFDAPVEVYSAFSSRVVGCVGGENNDAHDLHWFMVHDDVKHACWKCGQVFRLITPNNSTLPPGLGLEKDFEKFATETLSAPKTAHDREALESIAATLPAETPKELSAQGKVGFEKLKKHLAEHGIKGDKHDHAHH